MVNQFLPVNILENRLLLSFLIGTICYQLNKKCYIHKENEKIDSNPVVHILAAICSMLRYLEIILTDAIFPEVLHGKISITTTKKVKTLTMKYCSMLTSWDRYLVLWDIWWTNHWRPHLPTKKWIPWRFNNMQTRISNEL